MKKIFFKRWFCKHAFQSVNDFRGFFGITQCEKCGQFGRLPDEQMTVTTIEFPPIYISKE